MKKNKLSFFAVGLIVLGVIVCAVGILAGGWPGMSIGRDGIHMSDRKEKGGVYELEKTELSEFAAMDLDVEYADFHLIPSDGYYLEYRLPKTDGEPFYEIKDGMFSFRRKKTVELMRLNFDFIFEKDGEYYVNLYVPEDAEFEKLLLDVESGGAQLADVRTKQLEADISYGDAFFENISAKDAKISMESGDFSMLSGDMDSLEYEGEYGNGKFSGCRIGQGSLDFESGDLKMEDLELGQGQIRGEYGNVTVSLAEGTDSYELALETEYGDIDAPEGNQLIRSDETTRYKKDGEGENSLKITVESGDIVVK